MPSWPINPSSRAGGTVQSATNSNTGQAFLSDAAELDIAQVGANKPQSEGGGQGDSIHCYLETFVSSDVKT